MGADGKDSADHFAGGSLCCASDADTSMGFDRVYDSRFVNKYTESKFRGMVLDDSADDGNNFDNVYGEEFANKDTESHFARGTMLVCSGDYEYGPDPLRPAQLAFNRRELIPPARPKVRGNV